MNLSIPDVAGFEWDEQKELLNFQKHGIDFEEASAIFYGQIVIRPSDRNNEKRWNAIGRSGSKLIAVAFTLRNKNIRIISARRARKNEERDFNHTEVGGPSKGQD